ncbi:MAG: hypothetical protein AMJ88_06370 [Anaerolineae bacterium SM23_ 63]|nr:MAG: hypothetical protein AMJ88_06370 [Anaerolineae bacterium SM23_ 63]HEY47508.1 CapA family protein [Anaerolineae bacterium]
MRSSHQPLLYLIITLGLCATILGACAPSERTEDLVVATTAIPIPTAAEPTETAFQPLEPTSTAVQVRLWLSPALPRTLREPLEDLANERKLGIELVDDPATAQVRVEPNPENPISTWIYAFVTPFPTVQDGGSLDGLRGVWTRVGSPSVQVFASASTAAAMEGVLGPTSEGAVPILTEDVLLDRAWDARPSFAIVPFEALEPRWKVLEIDGVSPIRKTFDPNAYPLRMTFGLSGESSAVAIIREALHWPATNRDPNRLTVVVMTGTTALTRSTAWKMDLYGASYPGELIGHWLAEADLAHVSNEVAFTETCPPPDPFQEDLLFCSSVRHLDLLKLIGVDLIELTGNHVLDWGEQAFLESLELFHQNGWVTFGGGIDLEASWVPALFEHNGNRLAFLGCNAAGPERAWATHSSPGAAPCDFDRLSSEIAYLRDEGYLTVITFQWAEGAIVTPAQRAAFRDVVDAGALIVSGSQSHQPLGMEFYGSAFIHYGLGNLFFDQMQSLRLRQEFIDRHVFYNGKHISTEFLTAILEDYAQPRPMTPSERASFLSDIFTISGW